MAGTLSIPPCPSTTPLLTYAPPEYPLVFPVCVY